MGEPIEVVFWISSEFDEGSVTLQTLTEELAVAVYGWVRMHPPHPTPPEAQVFGLILLTVWFGLCSLLETA